MDVTEVDATLSIVDELVKKRNTELKFKRTYIPKPNGVTWEQATGARPFQKGVPDLPWRIYLHMLNNLTVWLRTGKEGQQHAYFPGRGVSTAWEEVFKRIDSPNIYEFDLTGFFDNVDLNWIYQWLI